MKDRKPIIGIVFCALVIFGVTMWAGYQWGHEDGYVEGRIIGNEECSLWYKYHGGNRIIEVPSPREVEIPKGIQGLIDGGYISDDDINTYILEQIIENADSANMTFEMNKDGYFRGIISFYFGGG